MPKIIDGLGDRILAAARERLLTGDLSDFSLRGIAQDCGIAVGTIYNYYKDKEQLLGAVMAKDWMEELREMKHTPENAEDPADGVLRIYRAVRSFSLRYEKIWGSYPTGAGFGSRFRAGHRMLLSQIRDILSRLYARFDDALPDSTLTLLSALVIAASQEEDVREEDLLSFLPGRNVKKA